MPKGISPAEAARRLASAGFSFAERYTQGTQGKGTKWKQGASQAVANHTAGVQKALAEGAFQKGVESASASDYDTAVASKGAANWPTGMQMSESRYLRGVQPFTPLWTAPLNTPRGPKGSPANLTRMTDNVKRFQAAKK